MEEREEQPGESAAAAAALIGKRPRPPMRRTSSMTAFSFEDLAAAEDASGRICHPHHRFQRRQRQRAVAGPPRIVQRRSFGDFEAIETTARFLMACGPCNRRLGPGCDTFIYNGEIAFCSLECRQQKMNQDEHNNTDAASSSTASETSVNGQMTVAA